MKISSREEYGLRCLIQLARHRGDRPLPISEIAVKEGLSAEYVGKLLTGLRRGGLVESVRGKAGGYVMARPAEEISLRTVLEILSEPIYEPGHCTRFSGTEKICVHVEDCGIRPIWTVMNQFLAESLERVNLSDLLVGEEDARRRLHESLVAQANQFS